MAQQMAQQNSNVIPNKDQTITDKIMKDLKDPITVFIIFFILSMPQLDNVLISNIAAFNVEGKASFICLLCKSILAGVIYYLGSKYL